VRSDVWWRSNVRSSRGIAGVLKNKLGRARN
jgi:hypothetical protein